MFEVQAQKWHKNDVPSPLSARVVMLIQFQFVVQDSLKVHANFQT
jgi:hypothetical protein